MQSSNLVGQVLLDRFEVVSFVAAGGMGAVYKAWDRQRSVFLAMKVLNVDYADDPSAFRHFVREAEDLKNLSHPNIVPFYGLYQDGYLHFMLESFVDGAPLSHILRQRNLLPLSEAAEYLRALSAALGYAHSLNVVHADVKPANVMQDAGGKIFLTDFGISRHMDSTTTTSFGPAGTPAYMAPEQVRGEKLTPAADIYALGVLFFEMITGRRPFLGSEKGLETYGDTASKRILAAHLYLPPPDPVSINNNLPLALSPVILKALEKDPANRYSSTNEFYLAVMHALEHVGMFEAPNQTIRPTRVANSPAFPTLMEVQTPRRRQWWWIAGGFLLLAGLGLVGILLVFWLSGLRDNSSRTDINLPEQPGTTALSLPVASIPVPTSAPEFPTVTRMPSPLPATATQMPSSLPATSAPISSPTVSGMPLPGVDRWVSPQDGMELIRIPAGPFQMGSNSSPWKFEAPEHTVVLGEYWIDKFPVTNALFAKYIEATKYITAAEKNGWGYVSPGVGEFETQGANWRHPFGPDSNLTGKEQYPVVQVTWQEAQDYCIWADRRLLTEAEWEKAARGEDGRYYPWGNDIDCSHANYSNQTETYCTGGLTPVDAYPSGASPYGVLDMTGNTWDWIADWYQPDYYSVSPSANPTGPDSGDKRGHRGGAWYNFNLQVQVSYRYSNPPERTFSSVGIRCGYSLK